MNPLDYGPMENVGKLERANPLPLGVYYVDVFEFKFDRFREWLELNQENESVAVISSAMHTDESPDRQWVLFEVKKPTMFPQKDLGFPTVAPKGKATTEDDTVQKPGADDFKLPVEDFFGGLFSGGTALLIIAALWMLGERSGRR